MSTLILQHPVSLYHIDSGKTLEFDHVHLPRMPLRVVHEFTEASLLRQPILALKVLDPDEGLFVIGEQVGGQVARWCACWAAQMKLHHINPDACNQALIVEAKANAQNELHAMLETCVANRSPAQRLERPPLGPISTEALQKVRTARGPRLTLVKG